MNATLAPSQPSTSTEDSQSWAITADCGHLCPGCQVENSKEIRQATTDSIDDNQWRIVHKFVPDSDSEPVQCDHCYRESVTE